MTDTAASADPTTKTSTRCEICGGALILGTCALHKPTAPATAPVPPTGPNPVLRGPAAAPTLPAAAAINTKVEPKLPWPTVAILLLLLVLVGGLGIVWSTTGRIESEQRAALDEQDEIISSLRDQVLAQQQVVDGANTRLAALEMKTGNQVDAAAVSAQVQPSVWTIETPDGVGSGFFLGNGNVSRHMVTNYHVVADVWETGGRKVTVRRDNGQQMEGTIERVHEYTDLALVSVQFDQPPLKRAPDLPKPGDSVVAVGSPLGLGGSVSSGIVSAIRTDGGESLIQFTAAVSPGSSGGPVVNAQGLVLGVTMAKAVAFGAEGVSFAIPTSDICSALEYCD